MYDERKNPDPEQVKKIEVDMEIIENEGEKSVANPTEGQSLYLAVSGEKFDENKFASPFCVRVGSGELPIQVNEAVKQLKKGQKALVTCDQKDQKLSWKN